MTRTLAVEIPIPSIETPTERALWVAVAVVLLADVVTTLVGLQLGLAESNPVARTAIDGWGLGGMLALKAGALAVGLAGRRVVDPAYTAIVPAALAIPWGAATVINCSLLTVVILQ